MSSWPDVVKPGRELIVVLEESRRRGFLGPGPVEAHVGHAMAMGRAAGAWVGPALDLGAGGGLPGLVLAALGPREPWVLLDAQQRRTEFLREAVDQLRLGDRVVVVRGRAEDVARDPRHRGAYGLVTARSFGSPAVTAECAVGLVASSAVVVVSEPPAGDGERWPAEPLRAMGLAATAVVQDGYRFTRLAPIGPIPPGLPRRAGVPAKRPLF